ncbi:MAG: A/G-specific adenine glycosylase [Bacteroidales bacterium]|nr:A/G-specific adenine glycosylase [Bacteroidales bacterium]
MDFKELLLGWYRLHGRSLPWRQSADPYRVWVSEVILQQTRVSQGVSYYLNFIDAFPSISALAKASPDDVMKVWQGLGYYTRARNLQAGAKQVMELHNGELPSTYKELLKIKGLGAYSAAAVASFAFNEAVPAIDGNVYRILARVFGIFTSVDSAAGKREFFELGKELIDEAEPAAFNQAIIDFGALVCTPRAAKCEECPLREFCYAYRNNIVYTLPVKGKRIVPRDRFFIYLMIKHKGYTYVNKRAGKDIWHSLYEFPLIETKTLVSPDELLQLDEWFDLFGGVDTTVLSISEPIKHQLSHLTLYARFVIVEVSSVSYHLKSCYRRIALGKLHELSVPRLIDLYLAAEPAEKYFRT